MVNETKHKDEMAEGAFSASETEFLAKNIVGRLATVSPSLQPHVVPVGYRFDGASIFFGGWNLAKTLKYRNLLANSKFAIGVDELVSTRPWKVRGVEVRGSAVPVTNRDSESFVKIRPEKVRSWGLE